MSVLKEELEPSNEPLYRQVNPSSAWVDSGRVTSVAFSPFEKDAGLLSVSCGSRTTAAMCYDHFTKTLGFKSVGVWAVTTQEVADAGTKSYWSPHEPPHPHPDLAHGSIYFREMDKKKVKTISKALAGKAHDRKRIYPPLGVEMVAEAAPATATEPAIAANTGSANPAGGTDLPSSLPD